MRRLGILPFGWLGNIASTDAADPRPFLVEGVRVRFDPVERKAVRAARTACAAVLRLAAGDFVAASDALTREMIRFGIAEWEGIGDSDGEPVAVTPETVDLFIADTDLCEAAEAVYVTPWLTRDREKNASPASSTGTSAAGTADNITAKTSANGKRTAAASRTRKPSKKKPVGAART